MLHVYMSLVFYIRHVTREHVRLICYFLSDIDDCAPNPCENDGSCIDGVNDYTCICENGFQGKNCSEYSQVRLYRVL